MHARAGGGGARGEKLIRATVCSTPPASNVASKRESTILSQAGCYLLRHFAQLLVVGLFSYHKDDHFKCCGTGKGLK